MSDKKKPQKKEEKRKQVDPSTLLAVWCHEKGIKGYDQAGNPTGLISPNSYGYVTRIVAGTQPANTDPMRLKSYVKKRAYKTRQIKAEE